VKARGAQGAHNWLIFRLIDPALERCLARYARGRLADVGCGDKPYAALSAGHVDTHVGFDHSAADRHRGKADVAASAYRIPAEDASFDTLLCTDVLEHLEEPGQALREAWRVLAPGGHAIYTVPLHWHLHEEPRDFYRFTRHGLRYLFEKQGFEVVEIRALTGFLAATAQALAYWLHERRGRRALDPRRWLLAPLVQLVQALGWLASRFEHSERFTAEYLVVAQRPAA
jgi:SAM-dependent methyltransferase